MVKAASYSPVDGRPQFSFPGHHCIGVFEVRHAATDGPPTSPHNYTAFTSVSQLTNNKNKMLNQKNT